MINRNVKIARELVKLAKSLVATNDNKLENRVNDVVKEITKEVLAPNGWRCKGSPNNWLDGGEIIGMTQEIDPKDGEAEDKWEEVKNAIESKFNRYSGHYQFTFEPKDSGSRYWINIKDTSDKLS